VLDELHSCCREAICKSGRTKMRARETDVNLPWRKFFTECGGLSSPRHLRLWLWSPTLTHRYDKTARNFLAFLRLVASMILLA